jgi:hypothetical protein
MSYKAKISIGKYNKGDVVPDSIAVVWSQMYKESPVEFIDDIPKVLPKEEKKFEELDINRDGKVDVLDKKLASKVLNKKIK